MSSPGGTWPRPRGIVGVTALLLALALTGCGAGPANEIRIPMGAGGVGFLPLYVMREHNLIERHAIEAGLEDLSVRWIEIGGPAVMNDALLSGSVDFIAAGPPAFLTLWDRTRGTTDVRGVAAIAALPMYLNTRAEHMRTLDDITERDRIAVTAVKVSIPAIVMQMYARRHYGETQVERFDRYTVGLSHPDALVALVAGGGEINAHFTSPPFHQRELKEPGIRTVMSTDDVLGGPTTFTMLSTTSAYRERNPEAYQAVLAALEEAGAMIAADPRAAAELLVAIDGAAGLSVEEIAAMLEDPEIAFTTTPQNVMTYAEFMHDVGSMNDRPSSWRDLFFPEVHSAPGS